MSELHLRAQGRGPVPEGGVEVVYADSWDDLCDAAGALHDALWNLHRFMVRRVPEYPGSPLEDEAKAAFRKYVG